MSAETWTQEEFEKDLKESMEAVRASFEKDGELAPGGVIFATRDPLTGVDRKLSIPILTDMADPERLARGLRDTAARSNAVGLLFANEAWCAFYEKDAPHHPPPSAHEARGEVVIFTAEHVRLGFRLWQAKITRDGNSARLGPWEPMHDVEGQLTRMLPEVN